MVTGLGQCTTYQLTFHRQCLAQRGRIETTQVRREDKVWSKINVALVTKVMEWATTGFSVTLVTTGIMKTVQGYRKLSSVKYHKLSICCSDVISVWITKKLRKQLEKLQKKLFEKFRRQEFGLIN